MTELIRVAVNNTGFSATEVGVVFSLKLHVCLLFDCTYMCSRNYYSYHLSFR